MVWACDEARGNKKKSRVVIKMNVEGKRGRPKKRWLDTIENDMRSFGMCIEDMENREKWMFRTKVADLKQLERRRRKKKKKKKKGI